MIQFMSVTMLYAIGSNLADFQFLYIDLFILVPLSIFMGSTHSYRTLTPHLPASSLLSLPVLTSVLGSVCIQMAAQGFAFWFVTQWQFYKPIEPTEDPTENYLCYENTSLFIVSSF